MDTKLSLNLKKGLTNKYVAYLDIMGFSNLVNNGEITRLESYFVKIIEVLDLLNSQKSNVQSFLISDSIILITPNTKSGFESIISAIRIIQSSLLLKKILLRGAVSFGEVYFNQKKNIIVGKGFIKAYLLEAKAIYSRVIIDPMIIKKFGKDLNTFLKMFNSWEIHRNFEKKLICSGYFYSGGSNEAIFIEYANKIIIPKLFSNENIKKIYETILENMYMEQQYYAKYIWLRDYFLLSLNRISDEVSRNEKNNDKSKESIDAWIELFERL